MSEFRASQNGLDTVQVVEKNDKKVTFHPINWWEYGWPNVSRETRSMSREKFDQTYPREIDMTQF